MKLADIFTSGMTLQRHRPIRIWGTDAPANLTVSWNGEMVWQGALTPGRFSLELPAMEAAENGTLSFSDGTVLSGVDIGEVWIAGGQSNMEFPLECDRQWAEVQAMADDPHLRFYDVGEFAFIGEREENLKADAVRWDKWVCFDKENRGLFSAVGGWFGLELRKELGVPVAIVGCNWGGTTASTWMDTDTLAADHDLAIYLRDYETATKKQNPERYEKMNRKQRQSAGSPRACEAGRAMFRNESVNKPSPIIKLFGPLANLRNPIGPHWENRPGGLVESMLARIAGFGCKGVIWYQGETDERHPEIYCKLFTAMIGYWRKQWQAELPFLFTQLAPFDAWLGCEGTRYPILRQQQQMAEDTVEGAYMASIMDVGSRYDIHPKEKQPVGHRLSLLAMDRIYGISRDAAAPRITGTHRSANCVTVSFDRELTAKGDYAGLFTIVQSGKTLPCVASLSRNQVLLTAPLSADPAELSFAYMPYCKMTLFGSNGLPARPMAPKGI